MIHQETFDFLRRSDHHLKRNGSSSPFYIHISNFEEFGTYADRVFKNRKNGKVVDLGDRIMFSHKKRFFSPFEEKKAGSFFHKDFTHICELQNDFYDRFNQDEPTPLESDVYKNELLHLSSILCRRGYEDLDRLRNFKRFGPQLNLDSSRERLDYFTRLIHIARKFPKNYKEQRGKVADIENKMNAAVEIEDYESAAMLRDQMYKMISSNK